MRTRTPREDGFSLIELMVVVLVIGILVAIAVPNFLRTQDSAKGRAAQSNARAALSAVKMLHSENDAYWKVSDAATLGLLEAEEPALGWVAAMGNPSASAEQVSWTSSTTTFVIAVRSRSNECFYVRDDADPTSAMPGTWFGKTVGLACDADGTPPVWRRSTGDGWPRLGASA